MTPLLSKLNISPNKQLNTDGLFWNRPVPVLRCTLWNIGKYVKIISVHTRISSAQMKHHASTIRAPKLRSLHILQVTLSVTLYTTCLFLRDPHIWQLRVRYRRAHLIYFLFPSRRTTTSLRFPTRYGWATAASEETEGLQTREERWICSKHCH